MHFYYCAGINSQCFAGAGGSGHRHCGSGRECNTHVAGAGGNGQKFSGSGMKKTVPRRALVDSAKLAEPTETTYTAMGSKPDLLQISYRFSSSLNC